MKFRRHSIGTFGFGPGKRGPITRRTRPGAGGSGWRAATQPGAWRSWVPFGNGTVGDWTCHVVDPVFWALDLGAPATIQAQVKNYDFKTQGEAFPTAQT